MLSKLISKGTSERGALMIEAIALLGLMTLMSPMIVRQTADRTAEMEEVTIAGQMKTIKEALQNYIEANYQTRAKALAEANTADAALTITAAELAPYLPSSYLTTSGASVSLKGNKLMDSFDVGIRAQCTEAAIPGCSPSESNNFCVCGTMSGGAVADGSLSSTCACTRYKMTGLVLSKTDSGEEIDDRRAARIASMIGADGGYMRTANMVNAVAAEGEDVAAQMQKILGAQGIWEGDVTKYIPGVTTNKGGKIAATTIYSSGFSGDYLYRRKVDGLPTANSMFTDLDMGGHGQCTDGPSSTGGCNRINNAGGLEVVGGRILIRSRNNPEANDQSLNADTLVGTDGAGDYASIALGIDNSHMKVSGNLEFKAGDSTTATFKNDEAKITSVNNTELQLNGTQSALRYGNTKVMLGASVAQLYKDDSNYFEISGNDATMSAGNMALIQSDDLVDVQGFNVNVHADADVTVDAGQDVMLFANTGTIEMAAQNRGAMILDDKGIIAYGNYAQTSNAPSFSLTPSQFNVNLGGVNSNLPSFLMNSSGVYAKAGNMNLSLNNTTMALTTTGSTGYFQMGAGNTATMRNNIIIMNVNQASGGNISVAGEGTNLPYTIGLLGNSGKVTGTYFQPELIRTGANTYQNPVISRSGHVNVADNGQMTTTNASTNTSLNLVDASVGIDTSVRGGLAPYNTHGTDTAYNRFRVDPAFVSVMNDIKLTSRGGARLSEAMPNYILKGIYELTNSYKSGPWPCQGSTGGDGSCAYTAPYKTPAQLGLSSGGWEFNCTSAPNGGGQSGHPAASCSVYNNKTVTFSTYAGSYTECGEDKWCFAHPYLGTVPAPGRSVTTTGGYGVNYQGEVIYGQDEGPCPDGYQAVITVTPTIFELGKLNYVNPEVVNILENADVLYNPGWQDFNSSNTIETTAMVQSGTKLGVVVDNITSGSDLQGWRIAMGTVTPTTSGYAWNVGGIAANSWSAIAHTYCYFNPERFNMPNMVVRGSVLSSRDNPNLSNMN